MTNRTREGNSHPPAGRMPVNTLVSLALVLLVSLLYFRAGGFDFIELDDNRYVVNNAQVGQGLTGEGVSWAFSSFSRSNWHPLTWLSHMLDVELFGMDPGRQHLTNVLFHALAAVLLFLAFSEMTGAPWRSGFAAGLFALHPLHVESVAWIAERKDVLSGFFFMTVLLVYAKYARRPSGPGYGAVILFFLFGLMSKPMLVTLPFILLLLDIWPLNRTARPGAGGAPVPWKRLAAEKIPLLVLSALSSAITLVAQQKALRSFDLLPLSARVSNAALSYVRYLGKMVWPAGLAIPYPYPAGGEPWWMAAGAVFLLAAISVLAVRQIGSRPYLAVGWFWYLIMLVPVIGLVQVGSQAMADRYTYLPLIGPFVSITWLIAEAGGRLRALHGRILSVAAAAVLSALFAASYVQLGYWRNGVSLFSHTLAVTADNADAHKLLAIALSKKGRYDEAISHFTAALRIRPDDAETHRNMGLTLAAMGLKDDAARHFREAVRLAPDDKLARSFLEIYGR